MRCPRCNNKLEKVGICGGEWTCPNDECNPTGLYEHYGLTQKEVNKNFMGKKLTTPSVNDARKE